MPKLEQLSIFLASPGDVPRERKYVDEVVEEVNRTVANPHGIILTVIRWERNTFSAYGNDPQSLINAQIAGMKQYALFVGIMWNRLGTPTKNAASGTVEEFDRAVTARSRTRPARPHIMFFFRDAPFNPTLKADLDQKAQVLEFKKRVQRRGVTTPYKTPQQFRETFRNQLILWLNSRPIAQANMGNVTAPMTTRPPHVTRRPVSPTKPLSRQPPAEPPAVKPTKRSPAPRGTTNPLSAKTAVLLDSNLYQSHSVNTRSDLSVILRLLPQNAAEKVALNALRPPPYQQRNQVNFAYQDDGFPCHVTLVEMESIGGKTIFIITLMPDDHRQSGYYDFGTVHGVNADQYAELRTRLLLLDEKPTGPSFTGNLSLSNWVTDTNGPIKVEQGLFPDLWRKLNAQPKIFNIYARLMAIYYLKANHIIEHILELKLGPVRNNSMTVRFHGERRSNQHGKSLVSIEVNGTCVLSKQ